MNCLTFLGISEDQWYEKGELGFRSDSRNSRDFIGETVEVAEARIVKVEIEYCEQWNYRPEADRVSAEIKDATGVQSELIGGSGGIFEIRLNGSVIWKKQRSGHFPEQGEAAQLFQS